MAAAGLTDGHVATTRRGDHRVRRGRWPARCGRRRARTPTGSWPSSGGPGTASSTRAGKAGDVGAVLRVRDRPLPGRHPRADRVWWSSSRSTSSTGQSGALAGQGAGAAVGGRGRRRCSPAWRASVPEARKYLPAARDYFAASLWRRLGLRINETVMLDIRDWRPDLGEFGKLHVRFGKGSRGRGPKTRLVPAINGADELIDWWLAEVRHQFGDDWADPDAPMLPSERRDPAPGRVRPGRRRTRCARAWRLQVDRWLPALVGPADPARAAPLLRLVAVWRRDGPQGDPGAARPRVAVDHDRLHPRPQRPHRAGLGERQPSGSRPASDRGRVSSMQWNLRLKAAERGIWKSTEMRRLLADAGLEISAGKMSALWTGTPTTIRLDDLDVICAVLDCSPSALLIREPDKVAARRPARPEPPRRRAGAPASIVTPRFGKPTLRAAACESTRPPAKCVACQVQPGRVDQARVDYCYECLPGGPFTPPPCRGCGSEQLLQRRAVRRLPPGGAAAPRARAGAAWPGASTGATTGACWAAAGGGPTTRGRLRLLRPQHQHRRAAAPAGCAWSRPA